MDTQLGNVGQRRAGLISVHCSTASRMALMTTAVAVLGGSLGLTIAVYEVARYLIVLRVGSLGLYDGIGLGKGLYSLTYRSL